MKIVMTSGAFDLLHIGHVRHLEECREQGDRLIVAVNTDSSIRAAKGPDRPVVNQSERVAMLQALRCVDAVVLFNATTPVGVILRYQPGVFCVGPDYAIDQVAGRELIESWGGRVHITGGDRTVSTTQRILQCRS